MMRRMLTYVPLLLLTISIVAVRASGQVSIALPHEGSASAFTNQAVVGYSVPNMPIRLEVNGAVVDSAVARIDGVFEFLGVACPRGPVMFKVVTRLRNGKEFSAERRMHIFGDPDTIDVRLEAEEMQSGGTAVVKGVARVLDKWGVGIKSGYFVTVNAESVIVEEEDVDPNSPGHQLRLMEGEVPFTLRSSHFVGPVTLTFSTNAVTVAVPFYVTTPRLPFMLVGSADGTVKHLSTTGETSELTPSDEFTKGTHTQGRFAATGRGSVFDDYLLTLSIDSDRKLQDRIFRDLDPNSLYSMYGDNSIVTYAAQSTSPLFAKLERNQSYLMYGDYNTNLAKNEFSAYNRSFTGGKLHVQSRDASLDVFGTVTNRKVVQEEIRGLGISGYYYLRQNNIVTGSEKIRIEVRDKFRSEIVLSLKENARHSDYEIDYVQGSLYFKQPIASLDDQGNPTYIVVSYEAITNSADNAIYGGAGEVTFFDAITLGATTIVEQREPKDYLLLGGNAAVKLGSFARVKGEGARSSDGATRGGAWKVEADVTPLKEFTLHPYYRKVDGTFNNATQSGSGRETGSTKYGTTMRVEPISNTVLSGDFYKQEQNLGTFTTKIRSIAGTLQQSLWSGSDVAVKVEDVKYDGENPEAPTQNLQTHSTLLSSRARATVVEGLTASAEFERNLRTAQKDIRPDAVGIGLEYQINKALSVYAQQKFLADHGQLTTVGVNTKVTDQTTVYGRYEIGNSISGERNAATIGLKNSLKLTEDLTANFLYEKTKNLSKQLAQARTDDHDALSLSLEYLPTYPLKTTLKGEYGEDANNFRRGFDFGLTYRLFHDLSLVTKATHYRSESRAQSGHTKQENYLFGVAYRPVDVNWLNMIAKIERKVQDNQVVEPADYYGATIASAHVYIEPLPSLEIGAKYAFKKAREQVAGASFSSLSDFILVRPQYDITRWLNVAGETRLLHQRSANDVKVGYSAELGFVFVKNTMISFGYNFKGYKDRDLVDYVYSVAGPYVTFRLKFTEELFGLGIHEQ